MEPTDLGKSSTGMQANIAGLLCYVLGWITGLVFFLIEKESKFVRFHAAQSIVVFGALTVLQVVIGIFAGLLYNIHLGFLVSIISPLIGLAGLILWIVLMIKAYQGEMFRLPIAADFADKLINKPA